MMTMMLLLIAKNLNRFNISEFHPVVLCQAAEAASSQLSNRTHCGETFASSRFSSSIVSESIVCGVDGWSAERKMMFVTPIAKAFNYLSMSNRVLMVFIHVPSAFSQTKYEKCKSHVQHN